MKNLFSCFLIVLFFSNCKKTATSELDKLPPITQEGKRTFGCLINGNACIPDGGSFIGSPPLRGYYDSDLNGQFAINCEYNGGKNTIIIAVDSVLTYHEYEIKDTTNKNVRVAIFNYNQSNICRYTGSLYDFISITGSVKISNFNLSLGIVSGTFNFDIKTNECGNYEVTNGRFDYKF